MRNWSPVTQTLVQPVKARSDRVSLNNRSIGSGRAYKVSVFLVMAGLVLVWSPRAVARPPVPAPVFKAVRAEWKNRADRVTAFTVISCETGGTYSTTIGGTRFGLFAFGPWERGRFGYGSSARSQAHGAHNYWLVSGWYPWKHYEPVGCA